MTDTVTVARISSDPAIMGGKPCVAGTRVTVEVILRRFAEGYSLRDVLDDYPNLSEQDVEAALEFAAQRAAKPEPVAG